MPPTVSCHLGRTWTNSSSSQLQAGYVKVNSAAKERAPDLVFSSTRLCTCSSSTGVQHLTLSFSASAAKSVISEAANGVRPGPPAEGVTDVLGMAPAPNVQLLAKASCSEQRHCETRSRTERAPGPGPHHRWERGTAFLLERGKMWSHFHVPSHFISSGWIFR